MKAAGGEYCDFCQIGKGCSIYERRPFACQVYRCLWVCGKGEESDRPDRLKIVLDLKAVHFYEEDIVALNLWEVEEGAINQPRVQQIMVANIEGGNVVVCRPYQEEPTYYFPKGVFSADEQQEFIEILKRTPGALGV
ncbi:MAG: hypothetical protein A3D44_02285 [Candidatus Staskawiczbacteria bacterium RIFCSPHIGHO2_02_FULL_42_22]|uniref:Uncharacterized protein n=1 Tax=Candidatus Staskawiczbacteria bacterium RIFCSPHIGHO2_02_FULL_42_22 TaxID=1802207 RepID=A0A1G2I1W0_9BACT|nr:MAG: hypothetical protein A3D44_02285 [Candidatus Staskawiczbacteria bacterium RIFCSPHIGHO2_02_FULL_42_22]